MSKPESVLARGSAATAIVGPLFVIYWLGTPEPLGIEHVLAEAPRARATHGAPMIQLVVVPTDAIALPSVEVRERMTGTMKALDANFDTHVLVLAAQGFLAAALHAFASTLALAGSRKPGRTRICRTWPDAHRTLLELTPPGAVDLPALDATIARLERLPKHG